MKEMQGEYAKVKLPAMKIIVTGGGRVTKGAMEVLDGIEIRKVSPAQLLNERFDEAVYTQLNSRDYNKPKGGGDFIREDRKGVIVCFIQTKLCLYLTENKILR